MGLEDQQKFESIACVESRKQRLVKYSRSMKHDSASQSGFKPAQAIGVTSLKICARKGISQDRKRRGPLIQVALCKAHTLALLLLLNFGRATIKAILRKQVCQRSHGGGTQLHLTAVYLLKRVYLGVVVIKITL